MALLTFLRLREVRVRKTKKERKRKEINSTLTKKDKFAINTWIVVIKWLKTIFLSTLKYTCKLKNVFAHIYIIWWMTL